VDDLIEGLIRLMNSPDGITGPINIGSTGEFTILQLAEAVISLTGSKSELAHKPLPGDDPIQRRPDTSLARSNLGGWQAEIELRTGLEKTIAYFRETLASGQS
jgi:UDP-glucuronate decarboxylase